MRYAELEYLLRQKHITDAQYESASKSKFPVADALRMLGISPTRIAEATACALGMPFIDLSKYKPFKSALRLVPKHIVKKYNVLPLKIDGKTLFVATAHANDTSAMYELRFVADSEISVVLASSEQIREAIERYYPLDALGTLSLQISSEKLDTPILLRGDTKVVGVFGYPVEHSLSPAMHNAAFAALELNYVYVPFAVSPDSLGDAIKSLRALGIVGVNLTIPHKEAVLPFLDEITDEARDIGAVNTVHNTDGRLLGDNTDGYGFFAPLREMGVSAAGQRVVVVGAGGAARAVVVRLMREGAHVTLANRTSERAERLAKAVVRIGTGTVNVARTDAALAEAVSQAVLIVQTTRIGMTPEVNALPPLPLDLIPVGSLVYDLVYNPVETRLLQAARERGCRTLSGVGMLVHQGAAAFQRWTGIAPPTAVMEAAVRKDLGVGI